MNSYASIDKELSRELILTERGETNPPAGRNSILAHIGNTPLLQIKRLAAQHEGANIFAKAEWFNPGGSVKDRAALRIILDAERSGALRKSKTIIDATSGNTGIAYAMIGAVLGYRVMLALPANAGREKKALLVAYGAEVVFTDPLEGTDGAQLKVKEIVAADPDRYFYPDQYNNDSNWLAHYDTTAPEIWEQTDGKITHFVAGVGTSGTFVGTSRRLKELNSAIRCISFQPDSPLHGLEGLKHMDTSLLPGIYDASVADSELRISTEEAFEMAGRLSREEGLFVGPSGGAAMAACLKVAAEIGSGVIVTVFPDSGVRYGSELVPDHPGGWASLKSRKR